MIWGETTRKCQILLWRNIWLSQHTALGNKWSSKRTNIVHIEHTKRHTKTHIDIQRPTKTYKDTKRHTKTYRDIQRHTKTYKTHKDIQRHTKAHKDKQGVGGIRHFPLVVYICINITSDYIAGVWFAMLRCEFKNPKIFSPRRSFPRTSLCLVAKVNKQTNQQTYKSTNKQINKQTTQWTNSHMLPRWVLKKTHKDIWRRRSKYQTNKSMNRRRKTDKQWFPSHTTLCLVGWWCFEFLPTNHDHHGMMILKLDLSIYFLFIWVLHKPSMMTLKLDLSELRASYWLQPSAGKVDLFDHNSAFGAITCLNLLWCQYLITLWSQFGYYTITDK